MRRLAAQGAAPRGHPLQGVRVLHDRLRQGVRQAHRRQGVGRGRERLGRRARARPATATPPRPRRRPRARASPRRRRRRPDSSGGEPRGATDRRGPAQGADHPARAGERRPHAAAVAQPRRRLDPAGAREVGPGRPPVREPGPVRPPRAGVRLAHRLRDPRRGGGQSRVHGRQHAPPAGRRQRLHAHRRRVHRPALPAAVRGRDRRGRPRGGDAARLRAAAVPAAQRPRAGRVRPRAPFRRLRRARGRRQPHVRADPAARPRSGHAGGGRAGRALRSGPPGDAGRLRLEGGPRAVVRAGGGPRRRAR